jgi:uncharacterized protein YbaP (TraB family)
MNNKNRWCLLGLVLGIFAFPAKSDGPVWKISKGGYQLYIGGTIHLLAQNDYPLPEVFDLAYQQASQVILELDMRELQGQAFQQAMLQAALYADDTTLQQVLKPDTYEVLAAQLAGYGVPIESFAKFRPGMVVLTLALMELQRLGLTGTGVDAFYSARATADRKTLGALETVQAQLDFIRTMGEGDEDALVTHTLEDLKRMPELMQELKAAWREGDINELAAIALEPWKNEFPELYQSLLVRRNMAWVPEIEAMLATRDIELVLVGALHLVGDEGVLAMLAKRGYAVEQLRAVSAQ